MIVLVVVLVLIIAELIVRAGAAGIRSPLLWVDWEAQNKVAAMDSLSRSGGASVVLVGSSMVDDGMDPKQLATALHTTRPVFNAAVQGSDLRTIDLWTRNVVVPRLHPRLVIIGFNSVEWNDEWQGPNTLFSRMVRTPTGRAAAGNPTVLDRIENWFEAHSELVRYRSVLRNPWTAFAGEDPVKRQYAVTPGGVIINARIGSRPYSVSLIGQTELWQSAFTRYSVGGVQYQALDRLVRALAEQHINVLLVRMPTTNDLLQYYPDGAADRALFDQAVSRFLDTHKVQFVDAETVIPGSRNLFADPLHLNRIGKEQLTAFLGTYLHQPPA